MSRELKQERSIPVQSRVDIKSLAELDEYWRSIGVEIKSMSQLISWSVDAFHEILGNNSLLPKIMDTVTDCHRHLEFRQLYQGSMKKRAIAKINAAMRFENLRYEGVDPASYDSREYKVVHNRTSVEPFGGTKRKYDKEIIKQVEVYEELERKEREEEMAKQKEVAMRSGKVIECDSESLEERHERMAMEKDKEIAEAEMMPPEER